MATLNTQNFNQIVQQFAAAVQSHSTDLVDFAEGSVLRSIAEADAANSLWLEALCVQLLAVTRLLTSTGADIDSFVKDYGLTRLGAQAATGQVTFTRFTAGPTAPFIPVGTLVKTSDASQSFTVYADTTNSAYSATLNGYTLVASVASVNVPVQAVVAGSAGNVSAGQITLIASSVPGIDTVVNSAAFTNGITAESDTALQARFILFINSLAKGTEGAIGSAIQGVQVGLQYQILENTNSVGVQDYGNVTVYVDDGSGAIPAATLTACSTAAQAVRAAGVRMSVLAATKVTANVTMSITTGSAYNHNTVVAAVVAAITAYINGTGLGNTLTYFGVGAAALAVAGVTDVTNFTINGGSADIVPAAGQTIKSGAAVVS